MSLVAQVLALTSAIAADIKDLKANKSSVVVLNLGDPDPTPVVNGVLYLRKTS